MADADTYRAALKVAKDSHAVATQRLEALAKEQQSLAEYVGRLRRSITALAAMCSAEPEIDGLGITDSVAEVMATVTAEMTTQQVVDALDRIGFDIKGQKNAAASVHTVLKRLAKRGLVTRVEYPNNSAGWRGPLYDPSTEEIPF